VHVSIFWRVFLAQAFLIVLILAVCLYALFPLKQLTSLSEDLLAFASLSTDLLETYDASVDELERLRTIFVAQVSSAEQYVSERNADIKQEFLLGNTTVRETFDRIDSLIQTPILFNLDAQFQADLDTGVLSVALHQTLAEHGVTLSPQASVSVEHQDMRWLITNVDQTRYSVRKAAQAAPAVQEPPATQQAQASQILAISHIPQEKVLLDHVKDLYVRYATGLEQLTPDQSPPATWQEWRAGITTGIDTLMRMRKHAMADKTKMALRQAAEAARSAQDQVTFAYRGTGGLIAAGLVAAVLLSYLFARRISHPLRKLSRELRHVGRGEFRRSDVGRESARPRLDLFFTLPVDQSISLNGRLARSDAKPDARPDTRPDTRSDARPDAGLPYTAPEIKTAIASGVR
jgi:methyl-accepting chemotaxis protein